jgi:hypothetical protein
VSREHVDPVTIVENSLLGIAIEPRAERLDPDSLGA